MRGWLKDNAWLFLLNLTKVSKFRHFIDMKWNRLLFFGDNVHENRCHTKKSRLEEVITIIRERFLLLDMWKPPLKENQKDLGGNVSFTDSWVYLWHYGTL